MDIYLYLNEQQCGPFTEADLRDMLTSGSISSTDLAWREGMPGWQPLNTVISIARVAPPPPPRAAPPASVPQKLTRGLINCKSCGNPVSKKATACPSCGAPLKRRSSLGGCGCLVLLLIVGAVALPGIINNTGTHNSSPDSTPSSSASSPPVTPGSSAAAPPPPAPSPPPTPVTQADRDAVAADPTITTTRNVDGDCTGRYYNDVWKMWSDEPIAVYVDKHGNVYIHGGQSLIEATCDITPDQSAQVIDALTKSLDWSKQAAENKLETSKDLISFAGDGDENHLTLSFFASQAGAQTDVIMDIVGFDNQFNKIKLYLNPTQVQQLIDLLNKAPATYDDLVRNEIKAKNLQ